MGRQGGPEPSRRGDDYAGDGTDVVVGGPGADTILGGPGRDVLNSRDRVGGNDTVDGGAGADVCRTDPGDTRISCP
ncbi:hypothetical protein [Streptomyces spiralis]|uniref:hypothetical protein n=1 Tax=Streptomyces spiralis TaxID=66376 RepID=UPI0033C20F46